MSKLLKIGASALTALGAGAGVASTIITVKEVINYEDHYEINTSVKYFIDGEEVSKEQYDNLAGFDVGYGKVEDKTNVSLDDFTAVRLNGTTNTFTCTISCGNPITEEGEYPVFAVPATYVVSEIKVSGFDLMESFTTSELEGYNIYTYNLPIYDEDIGGETWTVAFN